MNRLLPDWLVTLPDWPVALPDWGIALPRRLVVLPTLLAAGLLIGSAAGAGTASTPAAAAGTEPGTPLQLVGWAVCEPRVGGWEVTWAVVNLGIEDVTVMASSSELSGVRVGDLVPARDWIAGRLVEPRAAEESALEVTVAQPAGTDQVVGGAIELGACFGPRARAPRADKGTGSAEVRSAAGCDGLAVAVAGPATGDEAVVSLAVPGRDPVEARARPTELSDVVAIPAERDLTVDVMAGGEVVETLTWVRPDGCSRGVPTALVAGASVLALVLLAAGAFLLARRSRGRAHQ